MRRSLLPTLLFAATPLAAAEVRITYLANEGVAIESGSDKILIDALLRDSLGSYARHSADTQERIESGKAPFDGVKPALATHYHLDHWDAGAITRFLSSNPGAQFASTPQATGMLPSGQQVRVRALAPVPGRPERIAAGAITIEAITLVHGRTQNLGLRIAVGGKTLMHLGDAEPSGENFAAPAAAGPVDVLLTPYWWLVDTEAAAFLRETWKPRHVVAIHFGATDVPAIPQVKAAFPAAWTCTQPGESRAY